jgi:hypothetical protein
MRSQQLLGEGGLLRDGLQQRVLLQELAGDLGALLAAANAGPPLTVLLLRLAAERRDVAADAAANAAAEALRLELLLAEPCLLELVHGHPFSHCGRRPATVG